jgi:hypothetical protein
MDPTATQTKLAALYRDWRATLQFTNEQADALSPPLLLRVTPEYCRADRRVLMLGQETHGWAWNHNLQVDYPHYPHPWTFQDIESTNDFLQHSDSIEALCWAYGHFKFAARQPDLKKTPFWRAFSEVSAWPAVARMWSNVVRMDYYGDRSCSIWDAPPSWRDILISQHTSLIATELAILQPHVWPEVTRRSDLTHKRTNHELRPPHERHRARP